MARNSIPVVLAVGQTVSPVANGKGLTLVGFYLDKNFSGTAVNLVASGPNADVTPNSVTGEVYSSGSALSYTVAAGCYQPVSADLVGNGIDCVQLISGTTQATNPSTITFVFK